MELSAQNILNFIVTYSESFTTKYSKTWKKWYESNSDWTKHFFTSKNSTEHGAPFGDALKKHFEGYRYRTEDGLSDLALALESQFYEDILEPKNNMNLINGFWPKEYSMLVEHENEIYSCWQELIKMSYSKAKFKLLITYFSQSYCETEHKMLLHNTHSIKRLSNDSASYIIVIGYILKDKLHWQQEII